MSLAAGPKTGYAFEQPIVLPDSGRPQTADPRRLGRLGREIAGQRLVEFFASHQFRHRHEAAMRPP